MGRKILTFSYDDGVESDVRLIGLWNRYGLRGTVNLNAGLLGGGSVFSYRDFTVRRLSAEQAACLYQGHEIAAHGLNHLSLEKLEDNDCFYQLDEDKRQLEALFGIQVVGLAYPFGAYDSHVRDVAVRCGFAYARTTEVTHRFEWPADPLCWPATCRHRDAGLFALGEQFLGYTGEKDLLFCVWGHSYEFDGDSDWERMERFCQMMAGHHGVEYLTNSDALGVKCGGLADSCE